MRTFVVFTDIWLVICYGDRPNGAVVAALWSRAHRFGNLLALFDVGLVRLLSVIKAIIGYVVFVGVFFPDTLRKHLLSLVTRQDF